MSDEQIEVRISAKSAELKDGMDGSAQIVEAASARIKAAMANLDQEFKKLKDQFQKGLTFDSSSAKAWGDEAKRVFDSTRTAEERLQSETAKLNELLKRGAIDAETHARAIKNLGGSSNEAKKGISGLAQGMSALPGVMGKIQTSFAAVQGVLLAFTAVIAGGAALKATITASADWAAESGKLGKALGLTTEKASVMKVAMNHLGIEAETLVGASQKMSRQIFSNGDAFEKMGVKVKDSAGHYRPVTEVMSEVNTKLAEIKNPIDQNIAGMQIYGKGWSEIKPILKMTAKEMADAEERAKALGLVVGDEAAAQSRTYKENLRDLGLVAKSLEIQFGNILLPVFTELGKWFVGVGTAYAEVFGSVISGLGEVVEVVAAVVSDLWGVFKYVFTNIGQIVSSVCGLVDENFTGVNIATKVIRGAIGGVVAVFWGLKFAGEAVFNAVAYVIETATVKLLMFAEAATKALTLDFSGAKAAWQRGTEQLEQIANDRFKKLVDSAENTRDKIAGLFLDPDKKPSSGKAGHPEGGDSPDFTPKKKAESRMGQWETELEEAKTLMQEKADAEGRYYEMSKQEEVAFWQKKLSLTTEGSQENLAIRKKLATQMQAIRKSEFDASLADLKEQEVAAGNNMAKKLDIAWDELEKIKEVHEKGSAEYAKALQHIDKLNIEMSKQKIELAKVTAERERDIKLSGIEAEREVARLELDLGNITKEQLLQQEADFEERINTIRRQAMLDRQKEIDPNSDPVARAQIDQQLEQQEQQHQQRLSQIRSQITVERAKPQTSIFASMESSYEQALTGMITRTQTWRQALGNIYKQVGTSFIQEMISKPLAQWIAGLAKMLAQKLGFVAADSTATKVGAKSTIDTKSTEATAVVSANAAEAASGGASAVASIPYVGPIMAAAAFASILSMVLGAKSSIKSARGGYDIPAGINPVTQLHEEEMVLPSRYANAIRDMADGGGASGGGTIHYHDNSGRLTDTEIRRKARVIAEELNRVHRDGWRPA